MISDVGGEMIERTVKTWGTFVRSDLQAAIVFLAFFAWKSERPCFVWVSATALMLSVSGW